MATLTRDLLGGGGVKRPLFSPSYNFGLAQLKKKDKRLNFGQLSEIEWTIF